MAQFLNNEFKINNMKKLFLFLLSVIALNQYAGAQIISDPNEFYDNPAKFNGRTIILKDIKVRKRTNTNLSIGSGVQVNPGSGNPSNTTSNSVRCNAPRNYEILEVIFPNGKSKGCFVLLSTIPSDKDVTATITFKADSRTINKISMIKFIP